MEGNNKNRYLIKITPAFYDWGSVFIDGVVLEGNKDELYIKMQDIDYVISLGIHEDFFFDAFELVPEPNNYTILIIEE